MEKKLCKFKWDCGRNGYVEGLFFATKEELDLAIGNEVYFGEILGRHSEIYGTLEKDEIKIIDIPSDVSEILIEQLGETISGYNPLEYVRLECPECGDKVCSEEFDWEKKMCYECSDKK